LKIKIGDWGLGIGDWGLGIGDWAPIPNPQSPSPFEIYIIFKLNYYLNMNNIRNIFYFYLNEN